MQPGQPDFTTLELGVSHAPIEVDASEVVRDACLALIAQARREVVVMSRELDPVLFDNTDTSTALREFILSSRRTRLRILVKDPEPAVRGGHRLIALTQRLTSFSEVRVTAAEHANFNAAFLVVDGRGVVHRALADRYEATVTFNDVGIAGECMRQFEEMWQASRSDPSLRRLAL